MKADGTVYEAYEWNKIFNTANDRIHRAVGGRLKVKPEGYKFRLKIERDAGWARDVAIETLIHQGKLDKDFIDSDP